ncbi:hypothetical protein MAH1_21200 [Sessilibacter sp. MAH1]
MKRQLIAALAALLIAPLALGFDSGSTGADGNLNPTADISIVIPDDGILNYATINIPEGVTVRFFGNSANTPAFVLVQGDAVIDGTIDMSGINGGEFGIPPAGGYAGGLAQALGLRGGTGQGPGGATGGVDVGLACPGAGAGFFSRGLDENCSSSINAGSEYGSRALQPLLGGSGGGAGFLRTPSSRVVGLAGGGGGGAMLLAVSGTLTLNGLITAVGGDGASDESIVNISTASGGGGGSGGGIRIVTSTLSGSGIINVSGGIGGTIGGTDSRAKGGDGSPGRARIEAENIQFSGNVFPEGVFSSSAPRPLFLGLFPTIRIATIAGQAVPLNPTGENDLVLPANLSRVAVEFEASNVPVGSTVRMIIIPINDFIVNVTSDALVGTLEQSTASVIVNLPRGSSTLIASVAFAPNARQTAQLSRFTNGEEIVQVELKSGFDGMAGVNLHTVSGKVYPVPSSRLPL